MHPRNRHTGRYDFDTLTKLCPDLLPFVTKSPSGDRTIDFSNPEAIRALNRALLKSFYGLAKWEIPTDYLCPPIPGRADYLHHVADHLASFNGDRVPRGRAVRVLDIGVGASCIYPLIGNREYGWSFVGSDVDPVALASAKRVVESNPELGDTIELRLQQSSERVFAGVLKPGEVFDLAISNPPFHASAEEARDGNQRKRRNLGLGKSAQLNFGGKASELWCPGGETAFVRTMIEESALNPTTVYWYTTLISKESNLPSVETALDKAKVKDCGIIEMAQGQKKSRVVAWTFLSSTQQRDWRERWKMAAESSDS